MRRCDTVVQLSPRLHHVSVCLCSSLCAQSRPEGQTDVVNTSESPSRINQLHKQNKKTKKIETNHYITSHLQLLEMWTVLPPHWGFWPQPTRPPGNPSVTVMDGRPVTLHHLNKWNGAQKEKYSASSNIKLSNTDELETRSCFITRRLQDSPLSGNLGTVPKRSIITDYRLFFPRKDRNRLWAFVIQCQDTACVAMTTWDIQTFWPAVQHK